MSGGSHDYLCNAFELWDLISKPEGITRLAEMADDLAELGYAKDAAIETQRILQKIRAMEVQWQVANGRMRGVWKALEWWHSGDRSEECFKEALSKYRE